MRYARNRLGIALLWSRAFVSFGCLATALNSHRTHPSSPPITSGFLVPVKLYSLPGAPWPWPMLL
jgi:hypothetical protein